MADVPLMQFTSHIEGKNAKVAIYPDRIEWSRTKAAGGATAAVLTMGVSLAARRKDTSMILVRAIQGITTHKAGLGHTTVRVTAGGSKTEFRVTKREGEQVKATLLRLMSQPERPLTQEPVKPAATPDGPRPSVADELRKLAALRDSGVLTDAEFADQKARLLNS